MQMVCLEFEHASAENLVEQMYDQINEVLKEIEQDKKVVHSIIHTPVTMASGYRMTVVSIYYQWPA